MERTNLAYDLSRFDDTAVRKKVQPKKAPEIKKVAKTVHRVSPAKLLTLVVMVVVIAGSVIYSQVVLTELGDRVNSLTNQVNVLKSENIRKETVLDAKMSLKNVEEYAQTKLGYVKLDQNNIEYVSLSENNKVELKNGGRKGFLNSVKNFFGSIVEYFK